MIQKVTLWNELEKLQVLNQEKYAKVFAKIVNDAKLFRYEWHDQMKEYDDYVIVCERDRAKSSFIHVVPKEAMPLFRKMMIHYPNEFLGFSILCGKNDGQDLGVTCFGVHCDMLGKAIIAHIKQQPL